MSLSAAPHRSGGIRITWKLSSVWNGFVLYRSTKASGIYQPFATISSSRKSFTDKKVTAGKTYYAAASMGYVKVTPAEGDSPKTKGWYEITPS